MLAHRWTQAPRRLPLLFVAVMLVPVLALGWLTRQLLQRDRDLETQQVQTRAERAADRITVTPAGALVYYPVLPKTSEVPPDGFADGEREEYQRRDFGKASAAFELLTRNEDGAPVRPVREGDRTRCGTHSVRS